jgi:hypothetical protein
MYRIGRAVGYLGLSISGKKADLVQEPHSPQVIAQINDYYFKLVTTKRTCIGQPESHEMFICTQGGFIVGLRGRTLDRKEGDIVFPA